MINSWSNLNFRGRMLYIGCWINLLVAITLAWGGEWMCIFSLVMAMSCSFCTYDPKYQMLLYVVLKDNKKNPDEQ